MNRGGQLRRLTALQRKTPMKRGRWIKRRSNEPPELTRSKRVIRKRSGGLCEMAHEDVCTRTARHAHHVLRRGQHVDHSPGNLLDCCPPCHRWAHANPNEARERGWLESGHVVFGFRYFGPS